MGIELYPPADPEAPHPYGQHVALLAGADYAARRTATLDAVRAACVADVHLASLTTLADRLVQTIPEAPDVAEAAINSYASAYDVSIGAIDVWFGLPTGSDRGLTWPTLDSDKARIDSILAAMAP